MLDWWEKNFATCELGDRRLNERAMSIGKTLSQGFGKALSEIFNGGTVLKRAYEYLPTPKWNFQQLFEPHCEMTGETVAEYNVVLCVGDTTFLDYDSIVAKKEGYGPIGKGGNGLILHSALAIEPSKGQSIGLLWQKLWNREPKQKPPKNETPTQKKKRQAATRKAARNRSFEEKESYRWVEALTTVEKLVTKHTRVIHVFDREGDITEVFDKIRQLQHTGVVVRAAHNRSLDSDSERLWSKLEAQPISFEQEIELSSTKRSHPNLNP